MERQLSIWVLLELNFLSFLCLLINNPTPHVNNILVYYLIQAFGRALILMAIMLMSTSFSSFWEGLFLGALVLKAGGAPFHLWYLKVISQIRWVNLWLLSVWQKIIPLILISTFSSGAALLVFGGGRAVGGVLMMLAQANLKKILGLSSVFNFGWIIISIPIRATLWYSYLILYGLSLSLLAGYAAGIQISDIQTVKPKSGL